jgi:hypothetical protein
MQQFWGRAATFINTFVNPIGLDNISWRYYIWYCVWLVCEGVVIWWIYPETSNRTLEELSFCMFFNLRAKRFFRADKKTVFEGKAMQDEVNARVDKGLVQHHEQIVLPKRGEELIASQV